MRPTLLLLPAVAFLSLAGCSSVLGIRPPIPTILQGNIYDKEDVEKLKEGMSKKQVLYLLGTPLMRPVYAPDEWHYYRSAVRDGKTILRRLLVLNFEDEKLIIWEERMTAQKAGILGSQLQAEEAEAEAEDGEEYEDSDEDEDEAPDS